MDYLERKQKLLFVDDEPNFLNGMRRLLREYRNKYDMHFVGSVDDALKEVSHTAFDAIISDVQMPGKTGFDLLKTLRSTPDTQDIPIVILTGNAELDLKRKALNLGATDLLNKPVILEDLLARIKNNLRLKSQQDELKHQNEILEQKIRERTKQVENSRINIVLRLAKAGEYRDEETGNHIIRVGKYCREIATKMEFDDDFIEMITLSSPLHDIGKIGIPDNILLKPSKLTPSEWSIMQKHCAIGEDILKSAPGTFFQLDLLKEEMTEPNALLETAASIALNHHEKWDGNGYPNRKSKEEIPIEAAIVAFSDVYDALRSNRPYKRAFSKEETYDILMQESEKHFNPEIIEVFKDIENKFDIINSELQN